MNLLNDIDRQIVKQLENLFIKFEAYDDTQKVNAFQSIYIFKSIWERFWNNDTTSPAKKHKFDIDMLTKNCNAVFTAFQKTFN